MNLTVINEDKTETIWTVHVYRSRPENQNQLRATVCTLHIGDCVKAEDDDRAQCVYEKRTLNAAVWPYLPMPLFSGAAVCSCKDNFSRSIGRKVAFTRAIAHLSRTQRQAMWDAYFKIVKVA